ncbi:hypothetical protein Pfo_011686, partial [Paulownia fortunei]
MNPSTDYLLTILNDFSSSIGNELFPWNRGYLYDFLWWVLKSHSEFRLAKLSNSLQSLEDSVKGVVVASRGGDTETCSKTKFSLVKLIREVYKVLQLGRLISESTRNEVLADFIDFILQDVDYVQRDILIEFFKMELVKKQTDMLIQELEFLMVFLGDTVLALHRTESDGSEDLLREIKAMANQAGSVLYSFFLGTNVRAKSKRIARALDHLLQNVELVKAKIREHCYKLTSAQSSTHVTSSSTAVVSPYVLHFLVEDLEELMNSKADLIVDIKDRVEMLHEELVSWRSFLVHIVAGQQGGLEELEKLVRQIGDEILGAGHVIISLMLGEGPIWYVSLRLTDAINRIKLIRMEHVEIGKRAPKKLVVDDIFVGFEDEKIKILYQLVGPNPKHLQIISIIGMPGLGKTTLAKNLYNDPSVPHHFDKYAWGVVSQTYRRRNLLINILSSLSKKTDRNTLLNMEDESLATQIYQTLKGRRYLIVVDDIWDSTAWDDLRRCFPDDQNGSRVLFTSRNEDVAPSDSIIHFLPFLSDDQCWDLLQQKVFQREACPSELVGIGKQIAVDCQGLPLSVVVIAAVLANLEKKESLWQEVAESISSHISKDPNHCLNILELSYKHLPEHLKLCFLYFGAFHEDTEIPVRKLISLWIAEGFIHKEDLREEHKSLEDVGEKYLMDLISRSLVLVARRRSNGGVKSCNIHDLLRSLCLKIGKGENFLHSIEIREDQYYINSRSLNSFSRPFGLHVRSLLDFSPANVGIESPRFKLLRVLEMSMYGALEGIQSFVQLRYLTIEYFDSSLGSLVNLEVLIVRRAKLRYLYFRSRTQFTKTCRHLALNGFQMNNLQSLSFFRTYQGKDEGILRCFPHLRRLKCSFIVSKDTSSNRCFYPVINFLKELQSLNISLEGKVAWFSCVLRLPRNIKKLSLYKFKLSWKEVSMIGRLPKLEVLKLLNVAFEVKEWDTSDDEFQELRCLKLDRLQIVKWNIDSSDHFPKLERLVLQKFEKLEEIPPTLGEMLTLQMIEIQFCSESVVKSAMQFHDNLVENGNEELK